MRDYLRWPPAVKTTAKHLSDFDIHPLWGEFRNPATESEFLRHQLAHGQSQLRIALIFCSIFYVTFALTDIAALGYTRETLVLFLARLLVAVTAAMAIYLIHRRPLSIRFPTFAATAVEIIGMAAFMLIVVYRSHETPWHAMALSIMLIVVYLYIPNRLIYSLGVALASTAVFVLIALLAGDLKPTETVTLAMLLVLSNAFGGVAARRYQRLSRDEFRALATLKLQSVRDQLTGCYNRRILDDHILEKEIALAQRHSLWLTVILCDLDHFKSVNDSHGHHAGDEVLRTFAALLQEITREHVDYVIRYGGEEFLLVLPDTDPAGGALVAERLRAATDGHPTLLDNGQSVPMTASFGVASSQFVASGTAISQYALIAAADELLYKAKDAGRNCIRSCAV